MTEHRPHSVTTAMGNRHDYLPAAGRDAFLPAYDLLTRLLGAPRLHERLVDQADLRDDHRVLEIGCGTGNLTLRAKRARPAAEVVGTDPDPRALARAERKAQGQRRTRYQRAHAEAQGQDGIRSQRAPAEAQGQQGIRFERAYAQELPYGDGEFDRVLSSLMLHHLDTDIKQALAAEAFRVLRPGGRLHVVDVGGPMTPADGLAARLMLREEHIAGNLGDGIPRLLRDAGFDCDVVDSRRHRRLGRVTYYRAVRPD